MFFGKSLGGNRKAHARKIARAAKAAKTRTSDEIILDATFRQVQSSRAEHYYRGSLEGQSFNTREHVESPQHEVGKITPNLEWYNARILAMMGGAGDVS